MLSRGWDPLSLLCPRKTSSHPLTGQDLQELSRALRNSSCLEVPERFPNCSIFGIISVSQCSDFKAGILQTNRHSQRLCHPYQIAVTLMKLPSGETGKFGINLSNLKATPGYVQGNFSHFQGSSTAFCQGLSPRDCSGHCLSLKKECTFYPEH